jgi:hypothetical protein
MNAAQGAASNLYSPQYPPAAKPQQTAFQNLLVAIGIGVGNTAAHELGHQFQLTDMDCNGQGGCSGPAPADLYYEDYTADPPFYTVIGPPLRWSTNDMKILNELLFKK